MWKEFLKIPKDRVGALIGKNGETKQELGKELTCKVDVSSAGEVELSSEDSLNLLKAKNMVKAIGRGFSPQDSMELLDDENILHIINLQEDLGKKEKTLKRYKSRIIGSGGTSKKRIEDMTNTKISVYGKTVSIIGKYEDVQIANEAIFMLLEGMMHKAVFDFLEKKLSAR